MTYFIAPILRKQNYRDTRRMLNITFREWKLTVNMLSNVKIILAENNSICFVCESILDYDTRDKTCRVTHTQTYKIHFETLKEFNERRRKRKNIKIYNSYGSRVHLELLALISHWTGNLQTIYKVGDSPNIPNLEGFVKFARGYMSHPPFSIAVAMSRVLIYW